ncbi:NADH-quinone oxidoreductase subunit 5 family protein [Deinococcus marmoris]|uniref:NADH-ubiquinone oxidoreductase chain L n=1 Tax=Deinococcus marmoris TaxID=249408 RepID=A0A1U7P0H7_9DEIO|nr:NADH-quinone oxidoreductase subunit L [Deinococcus marmoris]OLV17273.1 NADH-ubiquinone oxidoreductase chain L [Deinococcus marmoris]OLV18666.1 NADH-ubiquinone oxidoreductase chain L [Deinococcus marmoris]
MTALLLLVPLAPLTASLLIAVWGRYAGWLNVLGVSVSVLALLLIGRASPALSGPWFESGSFQLTVGLSLDGLSRLLSFLVAGVGLLVSVYAVGYMRGETRQPRFFATLSFFLGAMLTLVLADSFALLFAAWEGVGLASHLLIGFHFTQVEARKAALRAFLMTRVGDVGLLLGWLLALNLTGTSDIGALLGQVVNLPAGTVELLALLFLIGAIGKSAQLPLTAWLPDAMVGPTPVSALLHSATMVAAGVYLLLRLEPLFAAAPAVLLAVAVIGGLTALFSALVATAQTDLKRVLAWSTVSQLGEMFFVYGLGGPYAAAFHLGVHALFKSALFLSAGAVQHAAGTLNLGKLGGLGRTMPLTATAFTLAGLTLAGVPPFGAFWSEEAILGTAVQSGAWTGLFMLGLIFLAGVYIARAGVTTFWPGERKTEAREVGALMVWPALILAVAALFGGLLGGALRDLLPFPEAPEVALGWRIAAIAASVLGLVWGGVRAARLSDAPALGMWPRALGAALESLTVGVAHLTWALSLALQRVEAGLDGAARAVAHAALGSSRGVQHAESGLDTSGRAVADFAVSGANLTARAEEGGFAQGADGLARGLGSLGTWLRGLESGKIYLYTLILFGWMLVMTLGAVLWR